MNTISTQNANSQTVSEKGRSTYTVTINGKNIENFSQFESSLWYLSKVIKKHEGRSIASESKQMSKLFSKEFLQKMINHSVVIESDSFKAVEAILNHYKKQEEKEMKANHVENLTPVLSEILTICRNKVIERFAPTRKALEDAVQSIKEQANNESVSIMVPAEYSTEPKLVLNRKINEMIQSFASIKFDIDLKERLDRYDPKREIKDQAQNFASNVYACFRFGTENKISEMENLKVETETFKLLTNLAKYCPLGTDEVKNIEITQGAKGFEINADLYSKGEFLNSIYTNAHSAGGWNIQSFHFRYKTTVKK